MTIVVLDRDTDAMLMAKYPAVAKARFDVAEDMLSRALEKIEGKGNSLGVLPEKFRGLASRPTGGVQYDLQLADDVIDKVSALAKPCLHPWNVAAALIAWEAERVLTPPRGTLRGPER